MGSTIRAGVIGTGFMGTVHARAIHAAGATLARVSSHTTEATRRGRLRMTIWCSPSA